jgi:sigma-B regulation protein RsbU (phosphoserine phosphatase)
MSARGRGRDVLVIDDDPNLRELVSIVSEDIGVTVLGAADCAEGLSILRSARHDVGLVLLDYYLPNMTAACCIEKLRMVAGPEKIPIVLITASVDAASRAAELALDRWVAKPFALAQLVSLLEEVRAP